MWICVARDAYTHYVDSDAYGALKASEDKKRRFAMVLKTMAGHYLQYDALYQGWMADDDTRAAFEALWRSFRDPDGHDYQVEAMLHALIEEEAYGRP